MKIKTFFFLLIAFVAFSEPIKNWDQFEKNVRDQNLSKDEAKTVFLNIYKELLDHSKQFSFSNSNQWSFPVDGYSISDVGKGGFKPDIYYGSSKIKGYNFYDGNKHGGHPAYDIFIHDINFDSRDDRNDRPVKVIAPVDLLIISIFKNWQTESEIRGGNYIWALNPSINKIFYFAHLDEIIINEGVYVKKGTPIGTLGRTGKNAFPTRSPTHLHLMVLDVKNDSLIPYDFYQNFKNNNLEE